MKNPTLKSSTLSIISVVVLCMLSGCGSKQSSTEESRQAAPATAGVDYEVTPDKTSLAGYYALEHIQEWYPQRVLPPVFDYNVDLSTKSPAELWLLRNEIFARNGYLFDDAVLRGYFNQFKWYQPIFDVPEFKVQLDEQEQAFVNNVLKRENELAAKRYARQGQYEMISMDHVHNVVQFKEIDERLNAALAKNNFAIVPAKHEQLFHVYDANHYQYVPNFITTDLYLQVLHKHFSSILQKVEEEKFIPLLTELLRDLYDGSNQFAQRTTDDQWKRAAQFSSAYLGIAYSLITGELQSDDATVAEEVDKITSAQGQGSAFLRDDLLLYAQFTPRGNYTKTPELEKYFRCVKWLNSAPIIIEDDERLLSAVLIASLIKRSPADLQAFERYNNAIKFIVGDEDNLSIGNLVTLLSPQEAGNPVSLSDAGKLRALKEKLDRTGTDRIRPRAGDAATAETLARKTILFTAGRYTFDAEILSRLIHVLQPAPKRPFPKGLDVFASLGNKTAQSILLTDYAEQKKWPAFTDTLNTLQATFTHFNAWDKNIYCKNMETFASLNSVDDSREPLFMKTPAWSKKELSTSLAAWTQLKHDMLLYAEQPYAAQAGEGGGPPPPMHVSYVEPNIAFWQKALQLLDFQEQQLSQLDLLTENVQGITQELREIGNLLLTVSNKELANETVTPQEFEDLSYLGGRIEYLTFRIFGSDHLPEKERLVAEVADVYNYNGEFLEEAVGMIDDIYVVTEINGKPYLTRGAMFSYYEFTSDTPLTDEAWREQVTSGQAPARPVWMNEVMVNTPSLESKPTWSF